MGGQAEYVGITNNLSARAGQYGARFSEISPIAGGVPRNQARSIEQLIMNENPQFQNKINSIAPSREVYGPALNWVKDYINTNNISW